MHPELDLEVTPAEVVSLQRAQADAVRICRDLLRYDTSNVGGHDGAWERTAAERVAEWLTDTGLSPTVVEAARGRTNVIARIEGRDTGKPALLVHGHLDVVPASGQRWTYPPFAGEIADGCLWGRGAVDMKDFLAMVLAVLGHWRRTGITPDRDIVVAFLADEEAGSTLGSTWLVEHHPDLFADCSEAISEVGGFSWTAPGGTRAYLIETAQKGIAWRKIKARGVGGHGSMPRHDNAVAAIAAAVARVSSYRWPSRRIDTVRHFAAALSNAMQVDLCLDDPDALERQLGSLARLILPALSHTVSPTAITAGAGSVNVIPSNAEAVFDARYLPGLYDDFAATFSELVGPDIEIEDLYTELALQNPFDTPLVDAMTASLAVEDPQAVTVPYCMPAGTDNTSFARLGIRGYGFVPLQLPADFDFGAMFHGPDERVPISALEFGTRVLARFLRSC
jgi:acetylornithine deacetylase/succinyl-diaminopimelate desuccinylase-like protein